MEQKVLIVESEAEDIMGAVERRPEGLQNERMRVAVCWIIVRLKNQTLHYNQRECDGKGVRQTTYWFKSAVVQCQSEDVMLNIETSPNGFQDKCLHVGVRGIFVRLQYKPTTRQRKTHPTTCHSQLQIEPAWFSTSFKI